MKFRFCLLLLGIVSLVIADDDGLRERFRVARERLSAVGNEDLPFDRWAEGQQVIFDRALRGRDARLAAPEQFRIPASELSFSAEHLLNNLERTAASAEEAARRRANLPIRVFNVKQYGAVGDGKTDDGPAIRKAIADARQVPYSRVELPPGRYRIAGVDPCRIAVTQFRNLKSSGDVGERELTRAGAAHLTISGASNLTLSGAGADQTELLFGRSDAAGILIDDSLHTFIRDLAVDYDPLPFTQGRICAVNSPREFDFAIDAGYPEPTAPHMATNFRVIRLYQDTEKDGPVLHATASTFYMVHKVEKLPDGKFRVTLPEKLPEPDRDTKLFSTGERLVFFGRWTRMYTPLKFSNSRNCGATGVSVYSGSSIAINPEMNDLIAIGNCRIEPRPGSDRIMATNADGIFALGNRIGPFLYDSTINRNGDDFFNFLSVSFPVWQVSETEIAVNRSRAQVSNTFQPGDTILVLEGNTYREKHRLRFASAEVRKQNGELLTVLRFASPLPAGILGNGADAPDYLVNADALNAGAVVSGNRFFNGFRMILRCGDALIENNQMTCRNRRGDAVHFGLRRYGLNAEIWRAGNVLLRDNRFDLMSDWLPFFCPGGGKSEVINFDIGIEGNEFRLPRIRRDEELQRGFDPTLTERLEIRNNHFSSR